MPRRFLRAASTTLPGQALRLLLLADTFRPTSSPSQQPPSCNLLSTSSCICTDVPPEKSPGQLAGEWFAILILLALSAVFSGLNLGLMSLDMSGLEILAKGGEPETAKYAKSIMPIRRHHNWILCTLLLGNVMTNSGISILLADKTSGPIGFVSATLCIVLLGEIGPQAICSKYPLWVGYHTLPLVWVFMALMSPLAIPISKVLDYFLGAPLATIYASKELTHLLEMHEKGGALDAEQTKIMKGALDLKTATVVECLTPLDKLVTLDSTTVLDHKVIKDIFTSGFSRIPVYLGDRHNTVGMILTKDLILYDPRQKRTVGEVAEFFERTPLFFRTDTTLQKALELFKQGRSHCAIVEDRIVRDDTEWIMLQSNSAATPTSADVGKKSNKRVVPSETISDPGGGARATIKTIGMVTLEDIMEEIIGSEVHDETEDDYAQRLITKDPSLRILKQDSTATMDRSLNSPRGGGGDVDHEHDVLGEDDGPNLLLADTISAQAHALLRRKKTKMVRSMSWNEHNKDLGAGASSSMAAITPVTSMFSRRLTRVLGDIASMLTIELQAIVRDHRVELLSSLDADGSTFLPDIDMQLSGEVNIGNKRTDTESVDTLWYSKHRDAYRALFTVSFFRTGASLSGGFTRRILFNSSDVQRAPLNANEAEPKKQRRSRANHNNYKVEDDEDDDDDDDDEVQVQYETRTGGYRRVSPEEASSDKPITTPQSLMISPRTKDINDNGNGHDSITTMNTSPDVELPQHSVSMDSIEPAVGE